MDKTWYLRPRVIVASVLFAWLTTAALYAVVFEY